MTATEGGFSNGGLLLLDVNLRIRLAEIGFAQLAAAQPNVVGGIVVLRLGPRRLARQLVEEVGAPLLVLDRASARSVGPTARRERGGRGQEGDHSP